MVIDRKEFRHKEKSKMFKSKALMTFICISSSAAFAEGTNILSSNLETVNSDNHQSQLSGTFGFTSNQLMEDVGAVKGNQHFGEFGLAYKSYSQSNTYKGFELYTRVNDQEVMMYSVKEAVIQYNYSDSSFAMGRKNVDWSHADKFWGLGKINNRVNIDFFEPDQEGLVGFFYEKKYKSGFNYSLFGSFVYVPELSQGMDIDKDNGTVTCKSHWCKEPSPSAPIEGNEIPIFYNVNYPDIEDVVLKYSVGARLGYNNGGGFAIDAFYLKKPENSISVSAEIKYELDNQRIFADVTPQFYYQDVIGGNIAFKVDDNLSIYGSAIANIPNKSPEGDEPYIEYTNLKPVKKKEEYLSGGIEFNDGITQGHAGYIARISEFDREDDPLAENPRWNQALNLSISSRLTRKLSIVFDTKFDMLTEDRLTMLKTSYSFDKDLVVAFGANIIGTNPNEESYWSDFENNDAVYSSLNYIF